MIIAGIEVIPLRIPFKAGTKPDASACARATCRPRTRCTRLRSAPKRKLSAAYLDQLEIIEWRQNEPCSPGDASGACRI
jgi:hypothetical protein